MWIISALAGITCEDFLAHGLAQETRGERQALAKVLQCSSDRIIAGLPYRTTVRSKQTGHLMDCELAHKKACDPSNRDGCC